MPETYYDAKNLDGDQIKAALEAIDGVIAQENNGKILAIEAGKIVAKSASEWTDAPVLEPITITENGTTTPPSGVDGFNRVLVNVQGGGGSAVVNPLIATENGTYNPPSGVDGFAPVTVQVPSIEFETDYEILADEDYSTFNAQNMVWGDLQIRGSNVFVDNAAKSVKFPQAPTMAECSEAYFDFGEINTPATVYMVGKVYEEPQYYSRNNLRIVSYAYAESSRNTQEFQKSGSSVIAGTYGNDVNTNQDAYVPHVFVIRSDPSAQKISEFLDIVNYYTGAYGTIAQRVYFAGQPNFGGNFYSHCPLEINRVIITSGPDSDWNICKNTIFLATKYGII